MLRLGLILLAIRLTAVAILICTTALGIITVGEAIVIGLTLTSIQVAWYGHKVHEHIRQDSAD